MSLNNHINSFDIFQDILSQIDESADEYMKASKHLSTMEKTKRVGDISKQFTKCKEYGDDKVSLAMQVGRGSNICHIITVVFRLHLQISAATPNKCQCDVKNSYSKKL